MRQLILFGCLAMTFAVATTKLSETFVAQQRTDSSLFAAAVVTQKSSGQVGLQTGAFGDFQRTPITRPMYTDASVRMENGAEILLSAAVHKLIIDTALSDVDTAIPQQYLPRGVAFRAADGTSLTLKHLLTHTSTLQDVRFASFTKTSPDTVLDLRTFVENYFLTSSGGSFSVAADVWGSGTPGTSAAYNYARVNIALLAYVVDQVIVAQPTLVSSATKSVMAYVQEKIIAPLGMSNTFIRQLDGSFPTSSYPSGTAQFTGAAVQDVSTANTAVATSSIHPAYFAAFMVYSSASDLMKLADALWLQSTTTDTFTEIGKKMTSQTINLNGQTNKDYGQTAQALGIKMYSGATVCADAIATSAVSKCPLDATTSVWGMIATGEFSQVSILCTDTGTKTCVTTTISFQQSTTVKSNALAMGLSGVSVQQSVGDTTTIQQTVTTGSSDSDLYGLWVFFGVLGVLLFVVAASYLTEYIIQPAPITSGVPVPAASMPQALDGPPEGMDDRY